MLDLIDLINLKKNYLDILSSSSMNSEKKEIYQEKIHEIDEILYDINGQVVHFEENKILIDGQELSFQEKDFLLDNQEINKPNAYYLQSLKDYPDLLKVNELAEYLKTTETTIYNMINSKKIKVLKVTSSNKAKIYRFPKKFIVDFLSGKETAHSMLYFKDLKSYGDVLDSNELSNYLRISLSTLHSNVLKNKNIYFIKVGKSYRFSKEHIVKYVYNK